jgi:hypothetical protein
MFVYVRLIDSQEHQYPKKNQVQTSRKNQKQDPKNPEKPPANKTGYPRSKEKPRKNQCSKNQVPESFNQGKLKSRSALNPGIL